MANPANSGTLPATKLYTQDEVDALLSKLSPVQYRSSTVAYTTAKWTTGSGGFSVTVPQDGWYYLNAIFEGSTSNTESMTMYKFQLRSKSRGENWINLVGRTGVTWSGTMPVEFVNDIVHLSKGDVIYPYIHTDTVGCIVDTTLTYILLHAD
jgi:hypothetical protein